MMQLRRSLFFPALLAVLLAGILWIPRWLAAPSSPNPQLQLAQGDDPQQVEQAIRAAIDAQGKDTPALLLFKTQIENIVFSQDGNWATAWLTPIDPDTAQPIPTEPGMALAQKVNGKWQAYLPAQADWITAIRSAPGELVPAERKAEWMVMAEPMLQAAAPAAALGGYRLPWTYGVTMRLTQSVGHDRYTASGNAHFSFDFATPGYPSKQFEVHAARGGRVTRARWTQADGSTESPGNYLVLEDTTTSPTTYQLYLHLAQNSIPENLRLAGAYVQRGQFIGTADDTGESSGNHLHFMVHTTSTSYWGRAVDIVFEDVPINGGRPRIQSDSSYCKSSDVCNTFAQDYVSQNFYANDATPPQGGITQPVSGQAVSGSTLTLKGWASDSGGAGLASVQVIARVGDTWQPVGASFNTTTFSLNWDMCAAAVPEGPLDIALRIQDGAGNTAPGLPGLTHFSKSTACPQAPTTCVPGASQVALFAARNFQGECVVLGAGSYNNASSLGALGDNRASSIQVGANVRATLFSEANQQGRGETFTGNDSNLADNRIGKDDLSSLSVQTRSTAPSVPLPVWPAEAASFTADDSLSLSWQDRGGGSQFQARLLSGETAVATSEWQAVHSWQPGGLPAGSYTWQVRARNSAGTESAWSSARSLQLQAAPALGSPVDLPFVSSMENGTPAWISSSGWNLVASVNHSEGGSQSWQYAPAGTSYNTNSANAGSLTSPPIRLPAEGVAYLRFWYQYETETSETQWDQRWVQVSVDGGPFTNLAQLAYGPPSQWLQSPPFSLANYAGKTVRIRFYFATLDAIYNGYKGWFIDDVSVTTEAPPSCSDSDDQPGLAISLSYNTSKNAAICPNGDIDYFAFPGAAGDRIGAWVEAAVNGSPLDAQLTLFDSDGRSLLANNDDQVQYQRPDPWIAYQLPRSGTYYLRVMAWDHPSSGSANHTYTLHLYKDNENPLAVFSLPAPNQVTGATQIQFGVEAGDALSGVSHVEFIWHSSNWQSGSWVSAGQDWDGRDGWGVTYKLPTGASPSGSAVYARVYDWAGNFIGIGQWNLRGPGIFLPIIIKRR